jgi:hypothetical protein
VLAVVRAERIQLSPPGTDGGWAGTVESRDFLGESVDHRVRVGDVVLRARSAPGASVEPGSAVELRFDPSATTLVLEDADVAG